MPAQSSPPSASLLKREDRDPEGSRRHHRADAGFVRRGRGRRDGGSDEGGIAQHTGQFEDRVKETASSLLCPRRRPVQFSATFGGASVKLMFAAPASCDEPSCRASLATNSLKRDYKTALAFVDQHAMQLLGIPSELWDGVAFSSVLGC